MFSEMYTGTNFRPLCTAIVWPTISGVTVERRDQVLMTFFSRSRFIVSTFFARWSSTKGPFFSERAIYFLPLRLTMNFVVRLLRRVLYPFAVWPQGLTGRRPPEVLPSPPPSG